ncbi:MAG: PPOX class F420-dependent oxidoreductase [Thermoleophilaceae bacterium]|nr:PPOX class F420-dependent oxidoreductase [Thermoleophilaceae bacterium]
MAEKIAGRARELIEGKNFAAVASLSGDGTPHVVVTWVDTDGEHVLLNTAAGRTWPTNLERDPRVTVTVVNMDNPYEYVQVRGRVAERTEAGARDHIDKLSEKYTGNPNYPGPPDETRVIFKVVPERVIHRGG